jgi:hypothetical protein
MSRHSTLFPVNFLHVSDTFRVHHQEINKLTAYATSGTVTVSTEQKPSSECTCCEYYRSSSNFSKNKGLYGAEYQW